MENTEIKQQTEIILPIILSKAEIATKAAMLRDVLAEEGGATDAWVHLKSMEEQVKSAKEAIKDLVISEMTREGRSQKILGAEIALKNAGGAYNYEDCNDPVMNDMQYRLSAIKDAIDIRAKFLKSVPITGLEVLDESTSELVRVFPPKKVGGGDTPEVKLP